MATSLTKSNSILSHFNLILILFLAVRLVLMALVPVLGDEAYYIYWGLHPAGGYYDLPPMIGWWIAPFAKISLAPVFLRLPNLISMLLISFSIFEWLSHGIAKSRARLIASFFFLLPLPFLGLVLFPDIPLVFLSYFSAYLFFRAMTLKNGNYFSFFFSGALLGAAVLSKYFAGFLIPAYLFWFFSRPKTFRPYGGLGFFILGGLPFAFQHYLWNRSHCWANFIFNFVTRQNASDGPLWQVLSLFAINIILVASPLLWSFSNAKIQFDLDNDLPNANWITGLSKFLGALWMVPFAIFTLTALAGRGQGLHWLLFILPFFVMWSGLRFDWAKLERNFKVLVSLTGVLSVIALAVAIFPETMLKPFLQKRFPFEFAELTHRNEFIQSILPDIQAADAVFTEGYTFSSILNYDLQRLARTGNQAEPEVSVWGAGSRFGRTFDWTTDFSTLDGKRILVITPGWMPAEVWQPYFNHFKREERDFEGSHFHVMIADGFNSAFYLRNEMKKTIETYYRNSAPGCSLWDQTHR